MDQFQHIDVENAALKLEKEEAVLWDVRDPQSFTKGRAKNAKHLTNDTIVSLMDQVEFETPILVICYHGHSSQGVAQYLINQGFETVYSVDGGFDAWQRAGFEVIQG